MTHAYQIPSRNLLSRRQKEYQRDFIDPWFPTTKTARILDLGCGYGMFLDCCARNGYQNLIGVEREADIANYAKNTFGLSKVVVEDLVSFVTKEKRGSYEVVVAFNIIEHLPREVIARTLAKIHDLLTAGGVFIMEVPNGDSPLGLHTFFSDLTHQSAFTKYLLNELLLSAGFSSIQIYPRFVNSNKIIRLGQKVLARIIGLDDKLMFSGNLVAVGRK